MTHPASAQPPEKKPAIRASDADRERVAETVRAAVGDGRLTLVEGDERLTGVYACVHRDDLSAFTHDLEPVPEATPTVTPRTGPRPIGERPATTTSIAVMSGAERRGEWTPGRTHTAFAMMGGVELDLRRARVGGEELTLVAVAFMGGVEIDLRGTAARAVTVRAVAVMGGVTVVVDPDTRVEENGVGLMGGFADHSGASSGADGPVVRVTGLAIMGGVEVTRKPLAIEGDRRRDELPEGGDGRRRDPGS